MDTGLKPEGDPRFEHLLLDDLYGDLWRYSAVKTIAEAREKFPALTEDLVVAVMYASDECPECLCRWITKGGNHADGCKLNHLFP